MKFLIDKNSNKKGLTMIELLLAVAIFIVVVSIIFSLFLTGLKGQRRAIASQNVQDNARFLLAFIAKELRMSSINSVTSDTLDITRHDGADVTYTFDGTNEWLERDDGSVSGPINSEEVSVNGSFYANGIGTGDGIQPRVVIVLRVEIKNAQRVEDKAEIVVQTTLSPRNLEL